MRIVIVGDGKVGLALTQMLTEEEHDVTVVDSDRRALDRMQETCDAMAVQGHGASRSVLEEAGAGEADLLIAATSLDEVNMLSCLIANKMGCKHTIARVRSPVYAEDLTLLRKEMGLTFAINPEEACAREIFMLLQYPSFLAREQFAKGRVEIVRFHVAAGSPLVNIPLTKLYQASRVRVLVCAVERDEEVAIPHGNFVVREGDDLYVTADGENLAALIKNLGLISHKVTHVTIVGGSRVALYLALRLIRAGVSVKIIENNPERCLELADLLPDADIVEGDGTEQDILLSEGVANSDALVALTGIDEENIILSMYAKKIGVRTTITKCNRNQYSNMFRKMGMDSVVSPKLTSAEQIVRYVRAMENSSEGQMVTMHNIAGGKAEACEFNAEADAKVVGIPLSKLKLRQGVLVASLSRGKETVIPTGDSVIEPGDAVVVVTANMRILDLDDILEE